MLNFEQYSNIGFMNKLYSLSILVIIWDILGLYKSKSKFEEIASD